MNIQAYLGEIREKITSDLVEKKRRVKEVTSRIASEQEQLAEAKAELRQLEVSLSQFEGELLPVVKRLADAEAPSVKPSRVTVEVDR